MDELRELVALGEEDLGVGYKITAIKGSATGKIREEMDYEEKRCIRNG